MTAWLAASILALVPYDAPQRPTLAPQPELCLWTWVVDDGELLGVTHTVWYEHESWEARPGYWKWGVWSGWTWTPFYQFDAKEKRPLRTLMRRAWREARRVPVRN